MGKPLSSDNDEWILHQGSGISLKVPPYLKRRGADLHFENRKSNPGARALSLLGVMHADDIRASALVREVERAESIVWQGTEVSVVRKITSGGIRGGAELLLSSVA